MSQVINTNIPSLNAQRNLDRSQSALQVSLNRLSSGLRINSAKDDAAGLAITERFTSQINGLNQAYRNANDGISLAQTAEGDLQQVTNSLQRIRVLIVQAANATNSSTDKGSLMNEINDLKEEINRIGNVSKFNGVSLLNGSFTQQVFQVGANQTSFDTITVDLSINVVNGLQLQTVDFSSGASNSTIRAILSTVDDAINTVSATRSELGSLQLRFESVVSSLRITSENLTASRSRILDTDFAQETANMTRNQILQQAGTAMLAQANALPNNVLSLLR